MEATPIKNKGLRNKNVEITPGKSIDNNCFPNESTPIKVSHNQEDLSKRLNTKTPKSNGKDQQTRLAKILLKKKSLINWLDAINKVVEDSKSKGDQGKGKAAKGQKHRTAQINPSTDEGQLRVQ